MRWKPAPRRDPSSSSMSFYHFIAARSWNLSRSRIEVHLQFISLDRLRTSQVTLDNLRMCVCTRTSTHVNRTSRRTRMTDGCQPCPWTTRGRLASRLCDVLGIPTFIGCHSSPDVVCPSTCGGRHHLVDPETGGWISDDKYVIVLVCILVRS